MPARDVACSERSEQRVALGGGVIWLGLGFGFGFGFGLGLGLGLGVTLILTLTLILTRFFYWTLNDNSFKTGSLMNDYLG